MVIVLLECDEVKSDDVQVPKGKLKFCITRDRAIYHSSGAKPLSRRGSLRLRPTQATGCPASCANSKLMLAAIALHVRRLEARDAQRARGGSGVDRVLEETVTRLSAWGSSQSSQHWRKTFIFVFTARDLHSPFTHRPGPRRDGATTFFSLFALLRSLEKRLPVLSLGLKPSFILSCWHYLI